MITFKAKVETMYNPDDTVAYQFIRVPQFARKHCDMNAFRKHPKYGSFANSDMFPNILKRIRKDILGETIHLDDIPEAVIVDTSGFLAKVTIEKV